MSDDTQTSPYLGVIALMDSHRAYFDDLWNIDGNGVIVYHLPHHPGYKKYSHAVRKIKRLHPNGGVLIFIICGGNAAFDEAALDIIKRNDMNSRPWPILVTHSETDRWGAPAAKEDTPSLPYESLPYIKRQYLPTTILRTLCAQYNSSLFRDQLALPHIPKSQKVVSPFTTFTPDLA